MQATTTNTSVDLCIKAYNWTTGALVATASGCTDGSATPAARNATLTFATGTTEQFAIWVGNILQLPGTYILRARNVLDDYPDTLPSAFAAQPLAAGGVATSGVLNSTGDQDLFRYDHPSGGGGPLVLQGGSWGDVVEIEVRDVIYEPVDGQQIEILYGFWRALLPFDPVRMP